MTAEQRLMIVHAHPDDECLSTGGVLARYSAAGVQTVLVIATGGEEGEIVVPEMNTPENKAQLRELRAAELDASVAALGVHVLEKLNYRDSGMVGTPGNAHPESFHMADKDSATGRIVQLVRQYRPHVLISYDERGGYWHPDHLACHLTTYAAFYAANDAGRYPEAGEPWQPLKLYYTARPREATRRIWEMMRERGLPSPLDNPDFQMSRFTTNDARVTTVIDIRPFLQQKRAAIACHVTQISTESPFLQVPEDLALELFGVEYFTLVDSLVSVKGTREPETDLFAGIPATHS
jgi:mycothiol conjugate amidase Mca